MAMLNIQLRKWVCLSSRDTSYCDLLKQEFDELKAKLTFAYYCGNYEYMLDTLLPKLLM